MSASTPIGSILFVCLGDICRRSGPGAVEPADFASFDHVLAMDGANPAALKAPFMTFTLGLERDMPDPCGAGDDGFETVYRMLRQGCAALAVTLGTGREDALRS